MAKRQNSNEILELHLFETLETNPETRQVDLSNRLGVAVGTINWLLKRLIAKGYVKVKRIGQWRWRYLLTRQGFAEKARLTEHYLHDSMSLYRQTRHEASMLLSQVKAAGCTQVYVDGDQKNDLVDVCRLTCLEQGMKVVSSAGRKGHNDQPPVLHVDGREISLEWPKERSHL